MSLELLHKKCKSVANCKDPDRVASALYHHGFTDADAEQCEARGLSFGGVLDIVTKYGPQAIAIIKDILASLHSGGTVSAPPKEEALKGKK